MRLLWAVVVTVMLATAAQAWQWPWASAEEKANQLFVESAILWAEYESINDSDSDKYAERLEIIRKIDKNLNDIVSKYPGSTLAVELASSGRLRNLNQFDVQAAKNSLESAVTDLETVAKCTEEINKCLGLLVAKALEAAEAIDNASERAEALAELPVAQAGLGDVAGAKQTVADALNTTQKIADEFPRFDTLAEISVAQASSGDVAGALETVKQIDEAFFRAKALVGISVAVSKMK